MPRPAGSESAEAVPVLPAFLLHGENAFRAREFVEALKAVLAKAEGEPPSLERLAAGEFSWRDILDIARTIPFGFSPWRVLLVEVEKREKEPSAVEADVLRAYLADPTVRTTLVVHHAGRIPKTSGLRKAFEAAGSSTAQVREFGVLKGRDLRDWARAKFEARGCRVTGDALDRLLDLVEGDLDRIDREVEKLAASAGDRRLVDAGDVDDLTGGIKSAAGWELQAALEARDAGQAMSVLHRIFSTEDREKAPLFVLGVLSGFVRDLTMARLQAGLRSREDIYAELKANFVKACRTFPSAKCEDFFGLALRRDFGRFVEDLERIDVLLKTTDTPPQPLFEAFLADFCR